MYLVADDTNLTPITTLIIRSSRRCDCRRPRQSPLSDQLFGVYPDLRWWDFLSETRKIWNLVVRWCCGENTRFRFHIHYMYLGRFALTCGEYSIRRAEPRSATITLNGESEPAGSCNTRWRTKKRNRVVKGKKWMKQDFVATAAARRGGELQRATCFH